MSLGKEFVLAALRREAPFSALCEAYGVSRKTGYKWLRRYDEEGMGGLSDRSRAPKCHGRAMSSEVVEVIVEARRKRPHGVAPFSWTPNLLGGGQPR